MAAPSGRLVLIALAVFDFTCSASTGYDAREFEEKEERGLLHGALLRRESEVGRRADPESEQDVREKRDKLEHFIHDHEQVERDEAAKRHQPTAEEIAKEAADAAKFAKDNHDDVERNHDAAKNHIHRVTHSEPLAHGAKDGGWFNPADETPEPAASTPAASSSTGSSPAASTANAPAPSTASTVSTESSSASGQQADTSTQASAPSVANADSSTATPAAAPSVANTDSSSDTQVSTSSVTNTDSSSGSQVGTSSAADSGSSSSGAREDPSSTPGSPDTPLFTNLAEEQASSHSMISRHQKHLHQKASSHEPKDNGEDIAAALNNVQPDGQQHSADDEDSDSGDAPPDKEGSGKKKTARGATDAEIQMRDLIYKSRSVSKDETTERSTGEDASDVKSKDATTGQKKKRHNRKDSDDDTSKEGSAPADKDKAHHDKLVKQLSEAVGVSDDVDINDLDTYKPDEGTHSARPGASQNKMRKAPRTAHDFDEAAAAVTRAGTHSGEAHWKSVNSMSTAEFDEAVSLMQIASTTHRKLQPNGPAISGGHVVGSFPGSKHSRRGSILAATTFPADARGLDY